MIIRQYYLALIILILGFYPIYPKERESSNSTNTLEQAGYPSRSLNKVGDYAFPTNPMNDRAKGFLLQGKVKNAVTNYGNIVSWDAHPAGLWGDYAYLPNVTFMAGVPGQAYSSRFDWGDSPIYEHKVGNITVWQIWESEEAYDLWFENSDSNFVGILFDAEKDRGIWEPDSIAKKATIADINNFHQWGINHNNGTIFISVEGTLSPNKASTRIGLIRPWALRPRMRERTDDFDVYEYGEDKEEWTSDDIYMYYGATVSESWFTRYSPSVNTDWHASTKSRENTHNITVTAGDLFGDTPFTDVDDTYPLLAHSSYSTTWPTEINPLTGELEPFWPGWWAEDYYGDKPELWDDMGITNCQGDRTDPDCWKEVVGRFISDTDVYMEFEDRWAHKQNRIDTNDEYLQTGYPMGLRVMAEAHSYGVSFAEDIMFITVRVRNESGDWTAFERDIFGNKIPIKDEYGIQLSGGGMVMPDGTKLNRGEGFNYKDISLGFYMDADALYGDVNGYSNALHTNDDDYMEYLDCSNITPGTIAEELFPEGCPEVNGEKLRISMALIYDYDGISGPATDLGIVATQLLDSPRATRPIDLNLDGFPDIEVGEKLKMTDWHWFDWYNRPGVTHRESNTDCCAGSPSRDQAQNREEIMLKLLQGDTVNISEDEKTWFFHTPNPDTDLGSELNPHFDSLEGLENEPVFDGGLDCVFIMSCGPFDLEVGEEVPFSFCIIFGENHEDLVRNATFAQIMYNSHYQGYTPPSRPTIHSILDNGKVTLFWNDAAENSRDVVTGYSDFEGYKIYRSLNNGKTWGSTDKKIYDDKGIFVGWQPLEQFDLNAYEDSVHCIYENAECSGDSARGRSIRGPDPITPWYSLGEDRGFDDIRLTESIATELEYEFPVVIDGDTMSYFYVDSNVVNGKEYTYSVTGYDMGVEAPYVLNWISDGSGGFIPDTVVSNANPDNWSEPYGYQSIENSKGTTILDPNYITVYPGPPPQNSLENIIVVPNPYIARPEYLPETEYKRNIRFENLPAKCTITIFTISGEKVILIEHDEPTAGYATWDLRTKNNQEIAPGLYLYVVESGNDKQLGKFAVVR